MARPVDFAKKLRKIAASLEELATAIEAMPAGNGKAAPSRTRRSKKEAIALKKLLKADDTLDVFGVHGLGGILGALLAQFPPSFRAGDDATAPGAGRTQSFRQPLTEHQLVFGRIKVGGPMVFIHSATDDQGRADGYFYAVIALAAHRVRS